MTTLAAFIKVKAQLSVGMFCILPVSRVAPSRKLKKVAAVAVPDWLTGQGLHQLGEQLR